MFYTVSYEICKKRREYYAEYFSSVGGQSTEKGDVSWLIVTRGFSGHSVFHNDMERPLDMRVRGHPALSLLIPDSSFSLDSTRFNYQTGPVGIIRQR